MGIAVQNQLFINLIRDDQQMPPPRQVNERFECFPRVDGAGGIVRADHHQGARPFVDLVFKVFEVRLPIAIFIELIEIDFGLKLGKNRGIDGIIRAGHEHVLTAIYQGRQAYIRGFAYAVSNEDRLDVPHAFALSIGPDGLQRLFQTERRRIAVLAVSTASIRCGGVRKSKFSGSPMFSGIMRLPSRASCSATTAMSRIAYRTCSTRSAASTSGTRPISSAKAI